MRDLMTARSKELGDQEPVAFRRALLGTKKAEWLRKTIQTGHQQVAGAVHEFSITLTPIIVFEKQIPQFGPRAIPDPSSAEQSLNSLIR